MFKIIEVNLKNFTIEYDVLGLSHLSTGICKTIRLHFCISETGSAFSVAIRIFKFNQLFL